MAKYIAVQDGNFSTPTTWNTVTNIPTINSATDIAVNSASFFTQPFTAPDLVHSCTGFAFHSRSLGNGSFNVVLQQYNGVTWSDVGTISSILCSTLTIYNWNYITITPYTFTTLLAGYYRFRVFKTGYTSSTIVAADSVGSNIAFLATDSRNAVPTFNDNIFITRSDGFGNRTVIMDGTQSFGDGVSLSPTATEALLARSIGHACYLGCGGLLVADTSADVDITAKGNLIVFRGGEFRVGTVAIPYPSNRTFKWHINENGVSANYGIVVVSGGKWTHSGTPKYTLKTRYVSGLGTTISPVVLDSNVNYSVGDELAFAPSSNNVTNYNETEYRFVKTVISPNTYILSNTKGGIESALVNYHNAARVVNCERNIIFNCTVHTLGWAFLNESTVPGDVNGYWGRFEDTGGSSIAFMGGIYVEFSTGCIANWDYNICYNQLYEGFIWRSSQVVNTYTGNLVVRSGNLTLLSGGLLVTSSSKKEFNDFIIIDNDRSALQIASNSIVFNNFEAIGCNKDGGTDAGVLYNASSYNITFNNSEFHSSRTCLALGAGSGITFNNPLVGTRGYNERDIHISASTFISALFNNPIFGSPIFIVSYLLMSDSAEVAFDNLNGIVNNHVWYSNKGVNRSTGSGLVDTTVRTPDTLNLRIASENIIDGDTWEFQVVAIPGRSCSVSGFIYENIDFVNDPGSSVTVELYLPGSIVPDATKTMIKTTDSHSNDATFGLTAYYGGSVNRYATVVVTVKSNVSGAYVYVADIFNGTNDITNLKTWSKGKPSVIMFEQLGDAEAVWAVLKSASSVVGTMGRAEGDIDNKTNLIAALL